MVVNWALILSAFVFGSYLGGKRAGTLPDPQATALKIVYQEVLKSHIEPPNEHELLERAISGMVDGLDEYSRYIHPVEVPDQNKRNNENNERDGAKKDTHGETNVEH